MHVVSAGWKTWSHFQTIANILFVYHTVFLLSLPGCEEQVPHCDAFLGQGLKQHMHRCVPLSIIIALQPAYLKVWPNSYEAAWEIASGKKVDTISPIKSEHLMMQAGDICIFRQDLVHAGGAYTKHNLRIHFYCDVRDTTRAKNSTHIMNHPTVFLP